MKKLFETLVAAVGLMLMTGTCLAAIFQIKYPIATIYFH